MGGGGERTRERESINFFLEKKSRSNCYISTYMQIKSSYCKNDTCSQVNTMEENYKIYKKKRKINLYLIYAQKQYIFVQKIGKLAKYKDISVNSKKTISCKSTHQMERGEDHTPTPPPPPKEKQKKFFFLFCFEVS